jgi:RNA polymerase sigma-70 factor (ECF subfamily)
VNSALPAGHQHDEDVRALAQCADKDAAGLELLYRRHAGACLLLAGRVLRDPAKAEESVQEAFLELWRTASRYDAGQCAPRSWLLMLTHHKVVDRIRYEQRRPCVPIEWACDAVDGGVGPEQAAVESLSAQPLHHALAKLPVRQREAIVLAYWGGYTQREIARRTGAPLGTVKTRMRNGMLRLGAVLQGATGEPP